MTEPPIMPGATVPDREALLVRVPDPPLQIVLVEARIPPNVGATSRAIGGFDVPVVLIAGGQAKGADLSQLVPSIRGRGKAAVLIGEAAEGMERLFSGATRTTRAGSMSEAVEIAAALAESGDAVLLSPACASLDMFKDYADRGDAFKEAVRKLITDN